LKADRNANDDSFRLLKVDCDLMSKSSKVNRKPATSHGKEEGERTEKRGMELGKNLWQDDNTS